MNKYKVIEEKPATARWIYEVEANSEEEAFTKVFNEEAGDGTYTLNIEDDDGSITVECIEGEAPKFTLLKHTTTAVLEKEYVLQDEQGKLFYKEWIDEEGRIIDSMLRDKDGREIDNPELLERIQDYVDSIS
jgi:hypothetical protein